MKEYFEPVVEVISINEKDLIVTSYDPACPDKCAGVCRDCPTFGD